MKKFEAQGAQGKLAKSQELVGEKLEAPVQLTPEQLEIVAAGSILEILRGTGTTTTSGAVPVLPDIHIKL